MQDAGGREVHQFVFFGGAILTADGVYWMYGHDS